MGSHRGINVLLAASAVVFAHAGPLYAEQPAIQCGSPRVEATFRAALSSYHVTTTCSAVPAGFVNWDSRGSYDQRWRKRRCAGSDINTCIVS